MVRATSCVWVYEATDPGMKRVIYVGRTNDLVRRGAEHDRRSSQCALLREPVTTEENAELILTLVIWRRKGLSFCHKL